MASTLFKFYVLMTVLCICMTLIHNSSQVLGDDAKDADAMRKSTGWRTTYEQSKEKEEKEDKRKRKDDDDNSGKKQKSAVIVKMFASHYLDKPLSSISEMDIDEFLSGLCQYGRKTDVAKQILLILFGDITQVHVLNLVTHWIRNKRELIRVLFNSKNSKIETKNHRDLPDYNITFKDWKIGRNYITFHPDESVINEMRNIYEDYKCPKNPAAVVTKQLPVQLRQKRELDEGTESDEIVSNRRVKRCLIHEEPLNKEHHSQEWKEINKSVRSILNEISPGNMSLLTDHLKVLPIHNIGCLEIIVNLVFEKAIQKQRFAPLCSSLCSVVQSVQVISDNDEEITFKELIIDKCHSLLEINKTREMDYAKKLTDIFVCKDLKEKKELQLQLEKNKKEIHKMSVRLYRFMGELFKQNIITPNIMMNHVLNLITKHAEEPLECLCILLKTIGKELEKSYNLNDIYDKLKALISNEIKSKISIKIILMIEYVINLHRDECLSKHVNSHPKLTNKIQFEEQPMSLPTSTTKKHDHLLGENKLSPSETVEQPDSVVNFQIHKKCQNIFLEYDQLQNLDNVICSLSEDDSSVIYTRYKEFVKSVTLIALDSPITQTSVAGKMFAKLVSKKILPMMAITQGLDDVLKHWNILLMDFPQFFSYIAAIIAQLLLSQNGSFDFNSLKDSCTSIRPDNSCKLFIEVLYKINSYKETPNIKEELGGILWIYNKWNMLENIALDVFMPNNQINKYFKNDEIGVFILSISIYDTIKLTDDEVLNNNLQNWICTYINVEIIKNPLFVRALTIAIVILRFKLNYSYEDFFDHSYVKLLTHYIQFELLGKHEIQAREVECMYGIQIMSGILKYPQEMVLKLFNYLYQHRVISKVSRLNYSYKSMNKLLKNRQYYFNDLQSFI